MRTVRDQPDAGPGRDGLLTVAAARPGGWAAGCVGARPEAGGVVGGGADPGAGGGQVDVNEGAGGVGEQGG